jgi:hypothetical protein
MVRNPPTHEFRVQYGGSGACVVKKFRRDFVAWTCALIALVRHVLHRFSCGDEMVPNAPKPEFRVQWVGSGAFVAKKIWHGFIACACVLIKRVRLVSIDFFAVLKRSETHQNMSLGSNGVARVRSLRKKIPSGFVARAFELIHKFGRFASIFVRWRNGPKRTKIWV